MIEKVFRDPVHNYVHVDHELIYKLINTKEFQRLRRIKQLGLLPIPSMVASIAAFRTALAPTKSPDGLLKNLKTSIHKSGIQMSPY